MIELKNVDWDIFPDFRALSVREDQKKYVSSSLVSLAEAYIHNSNHTSRAEVKAIFSDYVLIGYALIQYMNGNGVPFYDLHRFMIDAKFQGNGLGKPAFSAIMDHIRTMPLGRASKVIIEYMPENIAASRIYKAYGFQDTYEFNGFGEIKAEFFLIESSPCR